MARVCTPSAGGEPQKLASLARRRDWIPWLREVKDVQTPVERQEDRVCNVRGRACDGMLSPPNMNLVVVAFLVLGIGAFLVVKHRRKRWALLCWLPIATLIIVCGSGAFLQFHFSQGGYSSGMDGAAQATFDLLIWTARILVALGVAVLVLAFPRGAALYAGCADNDRLAFFCLHQIASNAMTGCSEAVVNGPVRHRQSG